MQFERVLCGENVDRALQSYLASVDSVGDCIKGLGGLALLEALKRGKVRCGPYPEVALFEAANRIMTDLVVLYGIRWILKSQVFPFDHYLVEYGHENNNAHDVLAESNGRRLVGEVFNVAPSFFAIKKASALKKLRATEGADFRVIFCNEEAVVSSYLPKPRDSEYVVLVKTGTDIGRVVPERPPEEASGSAFGSLP